MSKQKKNQSHKKQKQEPVYIPLEEYKKLSDEEKTKFVPVNTKYEKFPKFAIFAFSFAGLMLIVYIISCISPQFADFFNLNISSIFRRVFSAVSGIFPFSIAEVIIILSPIILGLSLFFILKYRCITVKMAWMTTVSLVSVLSILLSVFVLNFSTGYKGTSIAEKLDLTQSNVSVDELHDSTVYLADKLTELSKEIEYETDNFSKMPYSFSEMNDKLISAYDKFEEEHDFIKNFDSRLKPVMLSKLLSYTHITGIYSFFTGEANINVNFPEYCIPYTAAHELAHQRGIAREDEANMIAFLVCIGSDDPYIVYSGYFNMYEYMASALYSADKDLYKDAIKHLNNDVKKEINAYYGFFDEYKNSAAGQVSSVVNDTYLKVQGTEGEKSYGMVVDITVAYFKSKNIIV